jgi:hypothetical protein
MTQANSTKIEVSILGLDDVVVSWLLAVHSEFHGLSGSSGFPKMPTRKAGAEAMTDFLAGTVAFFFLSRASISGSAMSLFVLAAGNWL